MLIKEKARLVLVGVLTFCLVFTSTPVVALSLLAANPTNAYAENFTTSTDEKGNKEVPSPEESKSTSPKNASLPSEEASETPLESSSGSLNNTAPESETQHQSAQNNPSNTSGNAPIPNNPKATTDSKSLIDASDTGSSTEEHSNRNAKEFNTNEYVKNFKLTLESGDITKSYNLSNGEHIDITNDFPDGLSRSTTYVGVITLDIKALAEATNEYPLVPGDTITCDFPDILRPNSTMTGRLRDASADWDSQHNGVGNYTIKDGKLTLSYDEGYIVEKSGKILTSSIKFSGSFDTSTQSEDTFDFNLTFGSITIGARFTKLEIVRNLSIEKTGEIISDTSYRNGSARIDSEDNLTYTVKVTAGEDNTHTLTHVKVTDVFNGDSQNKVDLSTMKLTEATIDGKDIAPRCIPLYDDQNRVYGWDIGNLPAGESASLTFKIKINKEGISGAVKSAKEASPQTSAEIARTIKNTASASADSVPAVTDDYSTAVKNTVSIGKSTSNYDYKTQSQYFSITVTAPSSNRYTEYNVPIYDSAESISDTKHLEYCGISAMSVRHADGSSESLTWDNFSQGGGVWSATIPEIRPGDTISIKSFIKFKDSFFETLQSENSVAGDNYMLNRIRIGAGVTSKSFYANDLNYESDYSTFSLTKKWLYKNSPTINSNGTVTWTITGNEQRTLTNPKNAAGQTITDTLGPNQVFEQGNATVTFYNQDNTIAGRDLIPLQEGSTSFSYTIPEQYGTCGFVITYQSKITDWDTYVGPAKSYTNSVSGLWDWRTNTSTSVRARVASMSKNFIKQADDWPQWKTSIYSELENGDVYTDSSRQGVSYLYFTQDDLNATTLKIDNIAIDPSLYELVPTTSNEDGKYLGFTLTFKGTVGVDENGTLIKPSKDHPLTIEYKTKMVNPPYQSSRDYYNDATLTAGEITDSDFDYCRRANKKELNKSVRSSSNGIITWFIQANYWGYSAQPDGTCIVTDTLPAGTEFISAVKINGKGDLEVQSITKNEDGTTTLILKLSNLGHDEVDKTHPSDSNGSYEFHFLVKTKITDEDYLYGTESKEFPFTNTVTLTDRYGNEKSASAQTNIHHAAMQKNMTYNETTAPYAQFSIELNKDKVDLAPDSDMVNVVDVSSDSLAVDPNSFEVINATTGDPIPFEIDASQMSENKITIKVPDDTYAKITYNAQVMGMTGKTVQVGNTAYFEGHERTVGSNTISQTVQVLKATGQAVSEPMIWFSKRNEAAAALGGAKFNLYAYNNSGNNAGDTSSWELIRSGLTSTGDNGKGIKIESLKIGALYKLVETSAPNGYVLNSNPYYFALYDADSEESPSVTYPSDLDQNKVFQGPSGSIVTAYNQPYSTVKFAKMSDDGTQLEGAKLEVHRADGTLATDNMDNPVTMVSSSTKTNEFILAPGEYTLVETEAPTGYDLAKEEHFVVTGNAERTITEHDKPVSVVTITDSSKKISLTITKQWKDADNIFLSRPEQVTVQLFEDDQPIENGKAVITPEGPDTILGTEDDWTVTFDDLAVMKHGKAVEYLVRELNPSPGYEVSYSKDEENSSNLIITNTLVAPPTTIPVRKEWIDDNNANNTRPESITLHLFANGADTGLTLNLKAEGPDGMLDTEDDWTGEFNNINLLKNGELISYTVREDTPKNYRLIETPQLPNSNVTAKTATYLDEETLGDDGFTLTNLFAPEPEPDPEPSSDPNPTPGSNDDENQNNGQENKEKPTALSKTNDSTPLFLIGVFGATVLIGASGIAIATRKRKRN